MKIKTLLCKYIYKYRKIIAYLVFGFCSFVINMSSYWLCFNIFRTGNVPATVIAWILSVLFAFTTNKLWVFDSKSFSSGIFLREIAAFYFCRLLTGLADVATMYIAVNILLQNELLWKFISNMVVAVLNYLCSRLIVFKNQPHS